MAKNNVLAAASYLFGVLGGLIVYFISKNDKFARFHALQSMIFNLAVGVGLGVVGALLGVVAAILAATNVIPQGNASGPVILGAFSLLGFLGFASLLVVLWCAYQAFTGRMFKLPIIGAFAEKHA